MVNGFFLGGFQEGMSQRRESDRADRKQKFDEEATQQELGLRRRGLSLQAAGLGLEGKKFEFSKEKEANDVAYRNKQLSIQERALSVQAQAQAFTEKEATLKRANEIVTGLMGNVKETVEALKATGQPVDKIMSVVKPIVDRATSISDKVGIDSSAYMYQVEALLAAPTPQEIAVAKGSAAGAEKVGQATVLQAAGVPQSTAMSTAGIKSQEVNTNDVLTFGLPDGTTVSRLSTDSEGIAKVIANGGVRTNVTIQGNSLSALGISGPTKQEVAKSKEQINNAISGLADLDATLTSLKKNPKSVGVWGKLATDLGGYVAQVPLVGDSVANATFGDRETIEKNRTSLKLIASKLLPIVTNETSKFTDSEREMVNNMVKTGPEADMAQIKGSFEALQTMLENRAASEADTLRVGAKVTLDELRTREGIEKLVKIFTDGGVMTQEQAVEAVVKILKRNKIDLDK